MDVVYIISINFVPERHQIVIYVLLLQHLFGVYHTHYTVALEPLKLLVCSYL